MKWLLLFVPVALAVEHFAPDRPLLVFFAAALAIVPLAATMGDATEQLAERTGAGVGGLLNATFGNAAEMIIALAALRAGLYDMVKASLAGAILGNSLFALGLAMLGGGLRKHEQKYNAAAARSQATMLSLAVVALFVPAAYHAASRTLPDIPLGSLSTAVSIALLAVYALNLVYSLVTHKELFSGEEHGAKPADAAAHGAGAAKAHALPSAGRSVAVLAAATVGVAWMSELLVGAVQPMGKQLGLNDAFVGVFLLAVLGSAAEQFAAFRAARRDQMDLCFSITLGSSVQIALFVSPLLVLLSRFLGPSPMDLAFSGGLVLSILLAVMITAQVSGDGRSDWLRGVQLLAVYAILGLAFYFAPAR
jgi:Ca2+:H+ antiporter